MGDYDKFVCYLIAAETSPPTAPITEDEGKNTDGSGLKAGPSTMARTEGLKVDPSTMPKSEEYWLSCQKSEFSWSGHFAGFFEEESSVETDPMWGKEVGSDGEEMASSYLLIQIWKEPMQPRKRRNVLLGYYHILLLWLLVICYYQLSNFLKS